jgi:hypothetical protein
VVHLDQFEHTIRAPRELYYDESAGEWAALEVIDAEGTSHIVQLKDPLLLPAPDSDR